VPPCETHAFQITSLQQTKDPKHTPVNRHHSTLPPAVQPLTAFTFASTSDSIPANSKNQSCTTAKKFRFAGIAAPPRTHPRNTANPKKNFDIFAARCRLFAVPFGTSTFPPCSRKDSVTFPQTPNPPLRQHNRPRKTASRCHAWPVIHCSPPPD